MFESLIETLDSLGVTYTEDYDADTLDIDIADVDKDTLVSVISAVNDAGFTFSISETNLTVEGGEAPAAEPTEEEGTEDYMGEALSQYGQ